MTAFVCCEHDEQCELSGAPCRDHPSRARTRLVILESPYAGSSRWRLVAAFQRWRNRRYARACVRDALARGEAPIASHLLYTQPGILCDQVPHERQWGIDAGLAWRRVAEASVVYVDRGISQGMRYGMAAAHGVGLPVERRSLKGPADEPVFRKVRP